MLIEIRLLGYLIQGFSYTLQSSFSTLGSFTKVLRMSFPSLVDLATIVN
jgi:hypothetical protein